VESRARDIPRNRLIKEPSLFEMARKQPQDAAHLQRIEDIPSRTLRNDTETLLNIIRTSAASDSTTWPARLDAPLAPSEAPLMKALKKYVREAAEALNLPPELLIRKKEYEAIVRSGMKGDTYTLPERLLGWRYEVIGKGLLEVIANPSSVIEELGTEESISQTVIE
jgi:ribonuclease D